MRLLLITNDYPPKPGGIQQYLGNVMNVYPDEWHVIAPADEAAEPDERVSRGHSSFMWPTPRVAAWVLDRAAEFEPDVVLFGAPYPLPFLGPALRERLAFPTGSSVTAPK
jgi:phosphatidylinositol alpha-1,6-mannosyltransferase